MAVPSSRHLSIIELCLSPGRGGLEGYAAGLVNDLESRGHQVQVVSRPNSEFALRSKHTPALTLTGSRYYPLTGVRKLVRLAKNADVIHIHRSADLPLAALAKMLSRNHPALVYSRHMTITRDRRKSLVHRLMFRQVDMLLAITAQVAAAASACLPLPADRIRHLAPGVEVAAGHADCHALRPSGVEFVVGCFSRLEPAKGQHELIEALSILKRQGTRIGAIIAGPSMNQAYTERLYAQVAEAGLESQVHFVGALKDAPPAMACCEAVVMPSQAETLGLVLIEAMLQRVPVVATAAGGVLEVINNGETGLTYPVGDTNALARCLRRLVEDPEFRAGIARAGQAMARERHDRGRHLAQLEQILHSLQRPDD